MSRLLKDYDYNLPEELIAQTPVYPRDTSRLLVVNKTTGETNHKSFSNVIDYLNKGDLLVINDTKVIPARLYGRKKESGGKVEVLLLSPVKDNVWEALVRPARRLKTGAVIEFGEGELIATITEEHPEGRRYLHFDNQSNIDFDSLIDNIGEMPLPPYIKERLEDANRYQTVYAKERGSAAAPTAGLHFTPSLLKEIENKGVKIAQVTLHVGLGTFRPVQTESITDHHMHSEYFSIPKETVRLLNETKKSNKRIIAVGTTSVRSLESMTIKDGVFKQSSGFTDIFIYPGYKFKTIDALVTNFHLPKSTLLMLVSALVGREKILDAYNEAVKERYRFFSFGDAMLIV
ncbi:tRNA preQ1(34) S-adenosylmethionine ribosyltransferase-isomerase QueA [Clostridium sp. 'deep sea']|uniref:tRNA preQ1(34) S-adenosylmethionine ribosyltransferase-isomerase QueA n=1 Tax=Clostridium sp. 'deep sea' TaxID=2779445 RepID=UPI0018969ABD|nr:tRNA preQ1(34) S-adenosylmethionine ribosyltransferase-isomerase QueA [Clostridium sp. 'deep sea']QOR35715.1 tRNA preQ1(34) S-adenosylmethionine ribosyltransferase-isomerase QueA [Clostridium sp. 'deep sea']